MARDGIRAFGLVVTVSLLLSIFAVGGLPINTEFAVGGVAQDFILQIEAPDRMNRAATQCAKPSQNCSTLECCKGITQITCKASTKKCVIDGIQIKGKGMLVIPRLKPYRRMQFNRKCSKGKESCKKRGCCGKLSCHKNDMKCGQGIVGKSFPKKSKVNKWWLKKHVKLIVKSKAKKSVKLVSPQNTKSKNSSVAKSSAVPIPMTKLKPNDTTIATPLDVQRPVATIGTPNATTIVSPMNNKFTSPTAVSNVTTVTSNSTPSATVTNKSPMGVTTVKPTATPVTSVDINPKVSPSTIVSPMNIKFTNPTAAPNANTTGQV